VLASLATWIVAAIGAGGYVGVAALMAVESACIPLPSEVIMPFAGYLASTGRFSLVLAALAGAVGCNIGSTVAYLVGSMGGRAWIERWGPRVFIHTQDLERADRFFARFGSAAVLIARMLPVVRTFIALPAGIVRMRQLPFQIYTFVGSFIWCYALAYIGFQLGARWDSDPRVRGFLHRFDLLVVAVLLAALGLFVWSRRKGERRRR